MNYIAPLIIIVYCIWPSNANGQTNDFDYYLPPGEVRWVNDSELPDQRYLLLHKQNQLSYVRGLMVHIPNWGMHPYQSVVIRELYHTMPSYGWQSYALQPPYSELAAVPWQTDNNTPFPTPISQEALAELRQPLQQRLTQALQHLEQQPGYRIVVAEGVVAAFLIQLYATEAIPAPDALVVVGPYLPQWHLNNALAAQLASFSFPVLDLQPANASAWSSSTAADRVKQARRLQHPAYRQRFLPHAVTSGQALQLHQYVYGWLAYEGF